MGNETSSSSDGVKYVIDVPQYDKPWMREANNLPTKLSLKQSVSSTDDELIFIATDQEHTSMDTDQEVVNSVGLYSPTIKYQYHQYRRRVSSFELEQKMDISEDTDIIESLEYKHNNPKFDIVEEPQSSEEEKDNHDQMEDPQSSEYKHSEDPQSDHEDIQSEDTYEEDTIPGSMTDTSYNPVYDDQCDDIWNCKPLTRIIDTLKYYQSRHNHNYTQEISAYFYENKHFIINDYHHILNEHLNGDYLPKSQCNDEFSNIHEIIKKHKKLNCILSECMIYKRSNREREKPDKDKEQEVSLEMDILDSIHCCFLHSVHTGYRIIEDKQEKDEWNLLYTIQENEEDEDETGHENSRNTYFDEEISKLQSIIESKREIIGSVRGYSRMNHNKFLTEIESTSINTGICVVLFDLICDQICVLSQTYHVNLITIIIRRE